MGMAPRVVIIVPTFKERENIPPLFERIFAVARFEHWDLGVLVVDNSSPDGTAERAREEGEKHGGRLKVLERRGKARGLSSSVVEGIEATTQEVVAVMDADLSHRPEDLPLLLRPVLEGRADFVLGSRYLKESRLSEWSLYRKLNSLIPTLLSRPLTRLSDPMSGFFAFSRSLLTPAVRLRPLGYKIGLELLVKAHPPRVRTLEVPIHFEKRLHGRTKLGLRQQAEFLLHLARLYRYALGRSLREWRRSPSVRARRAP
jgi:dolichol-phosphate mannosyltransferase